MDQPWLAYPEGDYRRNQSAWGYDTNRGAYYLVNGPDDPSLLAPQLGGSGYDPGGAPPQPDYNVLSSAPGSSAPAASLPNYTLNPPQSPPSPTPTVQSLPPPGAASTYYGGPDLRYSGSQPGYVTKSVSYPNVGYPPPQPAYNPLSSAYPTPAPTGYATTPQGDNFTVDAQRFGEYENYLAGAGAALPAAAPPLMGGNGVPNAGAMNGATNYNAPYGGGGMSGGYPYPPIPGAQQELYSSPELSSAFSGIPDPRSFDPFAFSGNPNPMPPGGAMRGQVMQAGGFPGPAWAPAPPMGAPAPAAPMMAEAPPNRETLMRAMKMGGEIALANQPQGPRPMTGMEYVARKLKLDPNGGRSF